MSQVAQVVELYFKRCKLVINDQLVDGLIKTNHQTKIVVGDYVSYYWTDQQLVVDQVLARKNHLIRPQVSNVDYVIIVYPLNHIKNDGSDLLWWIMYYQMQHLMVIVVFSKYDLLNPSHLGTIDQLKLLLQQLRVHYFTYQIAAEFSQLQQLLAHQLVVLAGQSGVGKSTFLNHLNPEWAIKTQVVSKKNRGKHTTTSTKVYFWNDTKIIDAPGFSTLVFQATNQMIATGWTVFSELALQCKFSNCLHMQSTPECAVVSAVNSGVIDLKLYQIYCQFLKHGN